MLDVRKMWGTGLWRREKSRLGGTHCYLRVVGRWVRSGRKNSCWKGSSPEGERVRIKDLKMHVAGATRQMLIVCTMRLGQRRECASRSRVF
jgi:hypothetical protein